jgi:uncharacterized protein (UPF0548 family)
VFSLVRPTTAAIERQVAAARDKQVDGPLALTLPHGLDAGRLTVNWAHDHSRSLVGEGEAAFSAAKHAFARWAPFDLGWARVANPQATIVTGEVLAIEFQTFGLWSVNLSRIVETIDTADWFGFVYSTTGMHVEQGDERFLLEFDRGTGEVWYDLEAFSRPRHPVTRLGYPVARMLQHRFARESHLRVREVTHSA